MTIAWVITGDKDGVWNQLINDFINVWLKIFLRANDTSIMLTQCWLAGFSFEKYYFSGLTKTASNTILICPKILIPVFVVPRI